jgi:hypothetical protein
MVWCNWLSVYWTILLGGTADRFSLYGVSGTWTARPVGRYVSDNTAMNVLLAWQGASVHQTTYDVATEAAPWLFTNARWTHMRTEFVALSMWPHSSMTETLFVALHILLRNRQECTFELKADNLKIYHSCKSPGYYKMIYTIIISCYNKHVCFIQIILTFPTRNSVIVNNFTHIT